MYNRYLTAAQQHRPPEPPPRLDGEPAPRCANASHEPGGGLLGSLSQRLADFRLDADTLVVLAVVWFVLGDQDGEMDTELLAVLVVLLLLGI